MIQESVLLLELAVHQVENTAFLYTSLIQKNEPLLGLFPKHFQRGSLFSQPSCLDTFE
jgi:hypothetical protein